MYSSEENLLWAMHDASSIADIEHLDDEMVYYVKTFVKMIQWSSSKSEFAKVCELSGINFNFL